MLNSRTETRKKPVGARKHLNGIEAIRELKRNTPHVQVNVLTMHSDVDYVTEAFEAGANAYVLKSAAVSELADTIRAVMKGSAT